MIVRLLLFVKFLLMSHKKTHGRKCCKACTDQSYKRNIGFEGSYHEVLPWDCKKRFCLYIVRCRDCDEFYGGECDVMLKTAFNRHRTELINYDKRKKHTALETHFHTRHPECLDYYRKIEIAIVSAEIPDKVLRKQRENELILSMKAAANELGIPDLVMNKRPKVRLLNN
jgi:hypothetical protein